MHNFSPNPIKIKLVSSVWLAAYMLIVHFVALLLLFLLELEPLLTFWSIALITLSLIYHWSRNLLQLRPDSVIGLDWSNSKGWMVRVKSGGNLKTDQVSSQRKSGTMVSVEVL